MAHTRPPHLQHTDSDTVLYKPVVAAFVTLPQMETITPAPKPVVVAFEGTTSTLPTVTLPQAVHIPAEISAQAEESAPSPPPL